MKKAAYCWGPLKRKKYHGLLKNNSEKVIMVALIWVHEKGCLLLGTVEKKIKFHGLLKNNSVKAIMVALIRVHEKGCLLLGTVVKEKKLRPFEKH